MYRVQRFASGQPNSLLPEQESSRHLIAPPDDELIEMRPKNPYHVKMLMDSASLAGYDTDGILKQKGFAIPKRKEIPMATEDRPVLTISYARNQSLNRRRKHPLRHGMRSNSVSTR
jgi:hypothetical protein